MIDTTKVGQVAAVCMEKLEETPDLDGGVVEAVLLIVVAANEENTLTLSRVYSSEESHWKQLGLIQQALEVVGGTDG